MVIPSVHVFGGGGGGGGGGEVGEVGEGEVVGEVVGVVGVAEGVVGVGLGVGVVVGLGVGVGLDDSSPRHVTLRTVALTASYSRARGAHETSMLAPAATGVAPAGTMAGKSGPMPSSPATAARTRLALQVDAWAAPDSDALTACAVFMFPLVRMPTPVAPSGGVTRGRRPCAARPCNQIPPSTPEPVGAVRPTPVTADRNGASGSMPLKARVVMETLAGALSAATGAASPGIATRHHVASRTPRALLTESYAFVHPFIDTVDEADVWMVEIRSVPSAVPAGSAVRAVRAFDATNV